jgi:hypothetical protein
MVVMQVVLRLPRLPRPFRDFSGVRAAGPDGTWLTFRSALLRKWAV